MGYNNRQNEITEGLADEFFKFLDSASFKLVETRTGEEGEATYGSKQLISDALVGAVDPFLRKAFELGGDNGKVCKPEDGAYHEERVLRPVHFIEGVPPPPKAPPKRTTVSETMLQEDSGKLLPLNLERSSSDLVCRIPVKDIAEVAGQSADAFIVEHLRSKGFDINREIYREGSPLETEMIYRQRRR